MTIDIVDDPLMSLETVAELLGYQCPRSLGNRIKKGLPAPTYVKIPGRQVMFFRSDVIAFLRSCRSDANTST